MVELLRACCAKRLEPYIDDRAICRCDDEQEDRHYVVKLCR
jgi:hypothetical protein